MGRIGKWLGMDRPLGDVVVAPRRRTGGSKYEQRMRGLQQTIAQHEQAGTDEQSLLPARIALAIYAGAARVPDALTQTTWAVQAADRAFGLQNPLTWAARQTHADLLVDLGSWGEGLALLDETIAAAESVAGPTRKEFLRLRQIRVLALRVAGRFRDAGAEIDAVVAALGEAEWAVRAEVRAHQFSMWNLLGRHAEVLAGIEDIEREVGRRWDHLVLLRGALALQRGIAYRELGNLEQAEADINGAVRLFEADGGPDAETVIHARDELIKVLIPLGKHGKAMRLAETNLRVAERFRHRNVLAPIDATARLADARLAAGDFNGAMYSATEALRAARDYALTDDHPDTLAIRFTLAQARGALGEDVTAEHRAILEARMLVLGAEHPHTRQSMALFGG